MNNHKHIQYTRDIYIYIVIDIHVCVLIEWSVWTWEGRHPESCCQPSDLQTLNLVMTQIHVDVMIYYTTHTCQLQGECSDGEPVDRDGTTCAQYFYWSSSGAVTWVRVVLVMKCIVVSTVYLTCTQSQGCMHAIAMCVVVELLSLLPLDDDDSSHCLLYMQWI